MEGKQRVGKPGQFVVGVPADQLRIVHAAACTISCRGLGNLLVEIGSEQIVPRHAQLLSEMEHVGVRHRSGRHLLSRPAANGVEPPVAQPLLRRIRPGGGIRVVPERRILGPLRTVMLRVPPTSITLTPDEKNGFPSGATNHHAPSTSATRKNFASSFAAANWDQQPSATTSSDDAAAPSKFAAEIHAHYLRPIPASAIRQVPSIANANKH